MSAWGCEQVALVKRPDVERPGEYRGSDAERGVSRADEVAGTVERINRMDREIHLRTPDARTTVIRYDSSTVIANRGRNFPVDELRPGDLVLVQVRSDSRGERYADVIRLRDRDDVGFRR
jgi:hypothetical protein